MNIAVVGAGGRTGRYVVEQALARGHHVNALARTPLSGSEHPEQLILAAADVLDRDSLTAGLSGCDAVISAIGTGTSRTPTHLYSQGASNLLSAMQATGAHTLAVVSAAPAGPRDEQPPLLRWVAVPILDRLFGGTYDDMRRMEATLQESQARWVALRPPQLLDEPATGRYRADTRPLSRMRTLTCADLATALLDALDRPEWHGQALYVAN